MGLKGILSPTFEMLLRVVSNPLRRLDLVDQRAPQTRLDGGTPQGTSTTQAPPEKKTAHVKAIKFWSEVITVPETNSSHLKMDGWKIPFLLGPTYFQVLC